jgi:hypothetical protein
MLINFFQKNIGSTFSLKNVTIFSKNIEIFSNAQAGGKIKRSQFRRDSVD